MTRLCRSSCRWLPPLLAAGLTLASSVGAAEPQAAPEDAEDQRSAEVAETDTESESEETGGSIQPASPCQVDAGGEEPWLDKFRRGIFESICETARWFDGFFGSQRFDEEARETHGRAGARVVWDEHDELETDTTLKVRVDFPNVDAKVNAFVGRLDEEEFLRGTLQDDGAVVLPSFFREQGDEQWLLGLGYQPAGGARAGLDFDVGLDFDTPLEPYARGRYRRYWLLGSTHVLRARQSIYWRNQRGFGTSTRIDLERPFGERLLARWLSTGVLDQATRGLDWYSGVTLYRGLGLHAALAFNVGVDGETDRSVPIRDYGAQLVYRRRMFREWFFGELVGGVSWPLDAVEQDREAAWHLGFGFEIQFSGEDLGVGD